MSADDSGLGFWSDFVRGWLDMTLRLWRWVMGKLWPGRRKWQVNSSFQGPGSFADYFLTGTRWNSGVAQEPGQWLQVTPDHPRTINRVVFYNVSDSYPARFRLMTRHEAGDEWQTSDHDGPIDVKFDAPRKVGAVRVEILEPNLDALEDRIPAWAIHDVRLHEPRLLDRWLAASIKEYE